MKNWDWRAATAGAAAGLANGFFGAGGGMLLVPLLAGWCRLPGKTCFTTALAVMLPLTLVSLAIYWHSGQLPFSLAWPYLAGGFLGGVGGGLLLRRVPVRWLHAAMGLFILGAAFGCWWRHEWPVALRPGWGSVRRPIGGSVSAGAACLMIWLTALQDLPQRQAQGINLLYFLPSCRRKLAVSYQK